MSSVPGRGPCPHLATYDPLAADELQDPYPTYACAREEAPVFRSDVLGLWFITRYEDIAAAIRDTETFSSAMTGMTLGDSIPEGMRPELERARSGGLPDDSRFLATTDPPSHNAQRKLAQQAFTPRRVASLEPFIAQRTEQLCGELDAREPVDLMSSFAYPLTTSVIAGILGLGERAAARMRDVSEDLLVVNSPGQRELDEKAARDVIRRIGRISELHDLVARELAARRREPADDLLSALANSTLVDGTRMEDEDILARIAELILAGTDTTANLIAHAVLYVSADRDRWRAMGREVRLADAVVEETLRRRGSSKGLFRVTTRDVAIGGAVIPRGSTVQLLYGSANHDAAYFTEPEAFILDRPGIERHLAFGRGTHFCLGAPLARLEARVALRTLSRRFPELSVAPQELVYLPALTTHTLAALLVLSR